ncbi:uncharacterized protein LOC142056982 isoform X2 [Phalacrocorax aristotelis]|uniref:uncharacterized protein LOC142056982 isoform X2 n=1 Tax=Phalacrocorax aristotelis TaxID=126867 RepID=UPI003F4B4E10
MAAARPDLYESLQIRYPPSPTQAPAPRSPPAAPRWVLGTVLAVGTGVILVLGATLAALITLYVQGQADLRAAQAELAALSSLLLPDAPARPRQQRRRGRRSSDGGCRGCPWAGGTTRARSTSSRAIGSPGTRRRRRAAPRTPASPPSPAPRSRTTWRGRRGEEPTGSGWRPRAPAAPGAGWTGLPTPRPRVSGQQDSRTTRTTDSWAGRPVPRSTPWATASGTTITATSPSPGSARGT